MGRIFDELRACRAELSDLGDPELVLNLVKVCSESGCRLSLSHARYPDDVFRNMARAMVLVE